MFSYSKAKDPSVVEEILKAQEAKQENNKIEISRIVCVNCKQKPVQNI